MVDPAPARFERVARAGAPQLCAAELAGHGRHVGRRRPAVPDGRAGRGGARGAGRCSGNVHSADRWKEVLNPIVKRYENKKNRNYFRGDAAFAQPEIYEYLEGNRLLYAIRMPANELLHEQARPLLTRPVGRPPEKPIICWSEFRYQAGSWDRPRRVVAKVEWHQGELFPKGGIYRDQHECEARRRGSLLQ